MTECNTVYLIWICILYLRKVTGCNSWIDHFRSQMSYFSESLLPRKNKRIRKRNHLFSQDTFKMSTLGNINNFLYLLLKANVFLKWFEENTRIGKFSQPFCLFWYIFFFGLFSSIYMKTAKIIKQQVSKSFV